MNLKRFKQFLLKYQTILVLLFFVFFNIFIRLGTYSSPIVDRHNFRQTDTYSTILLMYESKTNIWKPKFFQAPNPENVEHYYLAEFPIYQWIISVLFRIFNENLIIARLVNALFFSLACFGTYLLNKKVLGEKIAFLVGMILAIFPSSFFWGRAITPDIMALAALILSITVLTRKQKKSLLLSSILMSIAVLIKPFYFAFILTHFFILSSFYTDKKWRFIQLVKLYLLPVTLFISWRLWFLFFPAEARTDPSFISLMHEGIGYFKYWGSSSWISLFVQERFMGELLTPLGGILSFIGLTALVIKEKSIIFRKIVLSWLAASSVITIFIAYGSYWHDYYALHWLPLCALLIVYGMKTLLKNIRPNIHNKLVSLLVFCFFFYYLAYLPFLSYTNNYFSNSAFYSDSLNKEYQSIQKVVPENEQILFLLPQYNPQPLNTVRRFGFIFDYTEFCIENSDPYETLSYYFAKGARYGALYIGKNDSLNCFLENHPEFMTRAERTIIFRGQGFFIFKLHDVYTNELQ